MRSWCASRARAQFLAVCAACVGCVGCAQLPAGARGTGGTGAPVDAGSATADAIVRLTNSARAQNGVPALRANAQLMEAARIHALQMAHFQRAEHTIAGAEYPTLASRLDAVRYAYSNAAENVAWNQRTPEEALDSWMHSGGHRANILDPRLTEMGAAMARSANGEAYWIQVFGRPR